MVPTLSRRELLHVAAAGSVALAGGQPASGSTALRWSRTYTPDAERSLVSGVAPLDGSRSLLAGTVSREYQRPFGWVALVDGTGTKNWEQRVGVPGSSLSAAVATDEGAVLAGRLNGPSGTQRGPSSEESDSSPWVLHVTERGDVTWTRTFQPDAAASTTRGLTARDGGYAVCGSITVDDRERPWASGLLPGGDLDWEWTRSVDRNAGSAQAVAPATEGVVLGGSSHDPEGESAWVARVRDDGTEAWHRELLATEAKSRIEALVPRNEGVLAVGQRGFHAQDHGTAWAVALDASGETVWEQEYPREQWNWVRDATSLGDGYVLLGTRETDDGSTRGAWVLRLDDAGDLREERLVTDGARVGGYAVEPTPEGGLLLAGDRDGSDGTSGWLGQLGGPAGSASDGGRSLPTVPGWVPPLLVGTGLGAGIAGLSSRLRED